MQLESSRPLSDEACGEKPTVNLLRTQPHWLNLQSAQTLDFVSKPDEIYAAFKPYFDSTSLQETAKPEMLPRIKHERVSIKWWKS